MIVAADGNGDFRTIGAALATIPPNNDQPVTIRIKNGIYREKIKITQPLVHLIGEDAAQTILSFDDHAKRLLPDGNPMNTFNSYSLYIGGRDFTAENLTFENAAGDGRIAGQAIAAYVDADRAAFKKCRFIGCQDTLFTGPLPKHPTPLGLNLIHPTLGWDEKEYTAPVRQYYEDCFIQGDIDFIFGSATAIFNRCEIFSNDRHEAINGYITAASTSPLYRFGYVFLNCRLTGNAPAHSVYLGRPWRDYANVAFIDCWMGEHIHPHGWHNWDLPLRETTATYLEYGSHGPGANDSSRVTWARILTPDEAQAYTIANIFSQPDDWQPAG